jgi:aminoglycoside phosphotransferase (APT) family kinase protein
MQVDRVFTDVTLVRRLLATQFPKWADLALTPAVPQGWDNRTFRLGENLSVRLPSAERYNLQVEKEQRWLPFLAPYLPLPIPTPVARGRPGENFPWPWSVYRWLEGEVATLENITDLTGFATKLAHFLLALQKVDPTDGPPPGLHSAFRGAPPETYDADTRRTIAALGDRIQAEDATAVWEAALSARWRGTPVWFHGDVAVGNLLVREGCLSAVIDFGCAGVGDPACDLTIAWTLLSGESREAFRAALPLDAATWARGRGWALWKALLILTESLHTNRAREAYRVITEVIAEHKANS